MTDGDPIRFAEGGYHVPDRPVIPFIEGDGTGPDIWAAASRVIDRAVHEAYGGGRKIVWLELAAGARAFEATGDLLPERTVAALREHPIAIKGPLTTPVGGGFRSVNVALRQLLDLYVCLRPVKWLPGVPSPLKDPVCVDYVVFRENTEDVYAGLEVEQGSPGAEKLRKALKGAMNWDLPEDAGIGIKPISRRASRRLVRAAIEYAIANDRKNVTLMHKGNIQKYTEGAFLKWGFELAREEYGGAVFCAGEQDPPSGDSRIVMKDVIADAFLQQALLRTCDFDVVATTNLNGDYVSDFLAAMSGGLGFAPGANINEETGHALFEATHGSAPKYAGLDKVNPGSVLLSGVLMLRRMGWAEAADRIDAALRRTLAAKIVTYDFARQIDGATEVSCSGFADAIIDRLA